MYAFDTLEKFCAAGPAAAAVMAYQATNPEISRGTWEFERGTVSSNGRSRAWAEFLHVAEAGTPVRALLSVIAIMDDKGGWKLSHTVTRAASP